MSSKSKDSASKYPDTILIESEISMDISQIVKVNKRKMVIPNGRIKRGFPHTIETADQVYFLRLSYDVFDFNDAEGYKCVIKYENLKKESLISVMGDDFIITTSRMYAFIKEVNRYLNPKKKNEANN